MLKGIINNIQKPKTQIPAPPSNIDTRRQQQYAPIEEDTAVVSLNDVAANQQQIYDRLAILLENQIILNNAINTLAQVYQTSTPEKTTKNNSITAKAQKHQS